MRTVRDGFEDRVANFDHFVAIDHELVRGAVDRGKDIVVVSVEVAGRDRESPERTKGREVSGQSPEFDAQKAHG